MEDLPEDIQSKILSCVALESVLECKLVSNTWNTLLSHRNVASGLLILSVHKYWLYGGGIPRRDVTLHFGYYDDILSLTPKAKDHHDQCLYKRLPKVKQPLANKNIFREASLIGSCNGLVCMVMKDETVSNVYVFNPFIGECFNLPTIHNKQGHMSFGFGYNSSGRNYKVVRIQQHPTNHKEASVQVYTLGGGDSSGWRNVGEIKDYSLVPEVILWNGSLHWLDWHQSKTVAFDLADEEFRYLPTTTPPISLESTQLTLLGGYLSIVRMDRAKKFTYIWTFKNRKKDDFAGEASWDWILEFSIPFFPTDRPYFPDDDYDIHSDWYQPFGVTKNNEVFLWYHKSEICSISYTIVSRMILCRYDPKTDNLIQVLDAGVTPFVGIHHLNSLVSLKALGVDSKTIGFAADCAEEYG